MTLTIYPRHALFDYALLISLRLFCLTALFFPFGFVNAEVHGTLTGTTDYIWRMYSKSNGKPAIQANVDYQHASGIFIGASASNFNVGPSEQEEDIIFPDSAQVEITPYLGWSYKLAESWRVDLQYARYIYDNKIYALEADYNEFYLLLHFKDLLSFQASYIDDYYGLGKDSFFYEATGRYPLNDYFELSSGIGFAQTKRPLDANYTYWNAGVTARYKFVALDLRYYDAREHYYLDDFGENISPDHPKTLKSTVVLSISIGF
jgi:uncharacterized protein (TIGR02001 family)